jgi:hypothetical protein
VCRVPHVTCSSGRPWCAMTRVALVLLMTVAAVPARAAGQSYRGWTGVSAQVIELRPFGIDTVPRSQVITDTFGRQLYEGQEVTCVLADSCTGYRALPEDRTVAATQDLSLTFWGLGVRGLSVTTLVRARARLGGTSFWPRQDDRFDAMLAYAQLARGPFRLRAGRQDLQSGLGFNAFDGVSGAFDRGAFRAEAYGGVSLSRGLREPANEAFRGLDDFLPDYGTYLVGGGMTVRRYGTLLTARYHREILSDRSSFVGERASLDFSTVMPRFRVSSAIDYDFSFQQVGKGHLTVSAPLRDGHWLLEVSGRRYVPYFELSTIWGFFEPVSYSEAMVRVGWSPSPALGMRISGGARRYGDTATPVVLGPLRDDGWRMAAGASWRVAEAWTLDSRYQLEWGPGAFLSTGDVSARYQATPQLSASATATSFQQIEEYRLGQGRALGAGGSVEYGFRADATASGGASIIRHRGGDDVFSSPWNQTRAWMSVRFDVGRDPGLANRGGRR